MTNPNEREQLAQLLDSIRQRLFVKSAATAFVRVSFIALPLATLAIAANQRWGAAEWNLRLTLIALVMAGLYAIVEGFYNLGARLESALAIDQRAHLKDRISSAYEFLAQGQLDGPKSIQVHDAIRHARALNSEQLFRFHWPRHAHWLPLLLLAFALSFFVPPALGPQDAVAAVDHTKLAQLEELKMLEEELSAEEAKDEELLEVLEKLKDLKEKFEKGEASERDVMLELARLDEDLRQKATELGVENLEGEMNVIVPQLMSATAAVEFANALKENQFDKAAEELQKLSDQVKQDKLPPDQKRQLAVNMGICAAKLGKKNDKSFAGNFADASEALEKSDDEEFESACDSIGDKLQMVKKAKAMKSACKSLGLCKASLGQRQSKEGGYVLAPKTQGKRKGGLKAGTAASGDPFGEANRLADSYRNMIRVTGQAGNGPVESETEITEGQLSQSQVSVKELHANFAAVAEEAIENEAIPLSRRYHVKKYFQSIRPKE